MTKHVAHSITIVAVIYLVRYACLNRHFRRTDQLLCRCELKGANTPPRQRQQQIGSIGQRFPGQVRSQFINARSEEHTSELQSLMRISYAVYCLKKKTSSITRITYNYIYYM